MRVLLLGGTGAMGTYLKDALASSGKEVYITSRKQREGSGNIHYIKGDAHDVSFLTEVLKQGWDSIVDFMVYTTEEFQNRAALFLDATSQYVFISSSRVYADSAAPIKESCPRLLESCEDKAYLATDEYALKKAREEDILTNSGKKNFTIIRPYITYGVRRLQLEDLECHQWLPRALAGRSIVLSKDIVDHYTTMTYGLDVAAGIAAIVGNEKALGETFHITAGESHKWGEVLDVYLDIIEAKTGVRPKVKWINDSLKLRSSKSQYQVLYDRLFDRVFDNAKIMTVAPDLHFTPLREGLKKSLEETMSASEMKRFAAANEAVQDRVAGERTPLSSFPSIKQKIQYLLYRYLF